MRQTVSFDDVLLEPRFSEVTSRSEVNLSSRLKNFGELKLPIIASPMDTVTSVQLCTEMYKQGGLAIIHRYNTIEEQVDMALQVAKSGATVGAAIGVSGDFIDRAVALVNKAGVKLLCIDVAHGHHVSVRYALNALRNTFGTDVHIMAGNVATLEGINDLADWGADSIRVGIGGGSICSTRLQTGHGIPTLQSVIDCAKTHSDVSIIADGGIKNSGDIVKALAAGADFVMLGSLLAGTRETPGEIIEVEGQKRKVYRGMASKEAQMDWKGSYRSFEGVSSTVPYKGSVKRVLNDLETGIRSGLSYSGAFGIEELFMKAKFVTQTSARATESSTHIERR